MVAPAAPMNGEDSPSVSLGLAPANLGSGGTSSVERAPAVVDAAVQCNAAGGFTIAASSSCYRLGDRTASWQEGRARCQAWGADLVEIGSAAESAQLAEQIAGSAWIGATDQEEEGTFRWVSGRVVEFMGWGEGQPNDLDGMEDCAVLRADDAQWTDVPCVDRFARQPLCERSQSASTADAG